MRCRRARRCNRGERIAQTWTARRRFCRCASGWVRSCASTASAPSKKGRNHAHAEPSDMPVAQSPAVAHGDRSHRRDPAHVGAGNYPRGTGAGASEPGRDEPAAPRPVAIGGTSVMGTWKSPVPLGVGATTKVFRPGRDPRRIAELICVRAWRKGGVRVFCWPCGTVAVAGVGSVGDTILLRECGACWFGTYARQRIPGSDREAGPALVDVLHDLHWAQAQCP